MRFCGENTPSDVQPSVDYAILSAWRTHAQRTYFLFNQMQIDPS